MPSCGTGVGANLIHKTMSKQIIKRTQEVPAILSGSELTRAIDTDPSMRRKRVAVTKEMVEDRLHELVLECLRCFSAALRPLGIASGGSVTMSTDFSRDPQELYDVLKRIEIGVAVRQCE
jgi:hypothetical protein